MPTLAQATTRPNLSGWTQSTGISVGITTPSIFPGSQSNPFIRTPMFSIISSADSLRQYYGDNVPQYRLIPIQS